MNPKQLYCPSCSQRYDLVDHLPRRIPKCDHRICSICCSNHLDPGSKFTCLFDGNTFHVPPQQGLDYFHVDFVLKEIIAGNIRSTKYTFPMPNREQNHLNNGPVRLDSRPVLPREQEDQELFDEVEAMEAQEMENRNRNNQNQNNSNINHNDEEFRGLEGLEDGLQGQMESSIQPEIDRVVQDLEGKVKMLKDARLNLEINHEKVVQIMEKKRQIFLKNMKYRFEVLRQFLKVKEQQVEIEVNTMFDEGLGKVSAYMGVHSSLGQRIQGTISEYEKTYRVEELENASREDITTLLRDSDKENLEKRREDVQRELDRSLSAYDEKFVGIGKMILGVSFSRDYLAKSLEKTAFERVEAMEEIVGYYNTERLEINRDVKLTNGSNSLVISGAAARNSMAMINQMSQMSQMGNMLSQMRGPVGSQIPSQVGSQIASQGGAEMPVDWEKQTKVCINLNKKMTEAENVVYIGNVMNSIEEIDGLKLICNDKAIVDQNLIMFYPFMCWNMANLLTLNLLFEKSSVTDVGLVPFFENIFLYLSNLKSLFIDISQLKVGDKTIEAIGSGVESTVKSLESFEIWATQAMITDRGITRLFRPFEKMKIFKLGLQNTKITSICLRGFVTDCLIHMKNIESLELYFAHMRVNDEDFDVLFDALQEMSAKKIEEEELFNTCCEMYGEEAMLENVPSSRLRNLVLNVSYTSFSDRGLARLIEHVGKMRDLEYLEVYLGHTKVTDNGVIALMERLPPLKRLKISVIETSVTLKIVDVIEKNVELVESLERLEVNMGGARNSRVKSLEHMKQNLERQRNGRRNYM